MHAYLFEVIFDVDGPHVNYGWDVSALVSNKYAEEIRRAKLVDKAMERINVDVKPTVDRKVREILKRDGLKEKLDAVQGAFLRARLAAVSLHLLKVEDPMTFDEIDALMGALQRDGKLRQFLETSKIA